MATEEERQAVWSIKAGEVHIAFRNGASAYGAVTAALAKLADQNPAIARALAKEIARSIGVIGPGRELADDEIEDKSAYWELVRAANGLPISEADREAIKDFAKRKAVVSDAIPG